MRTDIYSAPLKAGKIPYVIYAIFLTVCYLAKTGSYFNFIDPRLKNGENMNTPICNFLEEYTRENRLRLHMPGHKGEYPHDITEIYGADSLYESDVSRGIIGTSEDNAGKLFGSEKTFYSCGGSTLSIQAALAVLKSQGVNTIAASRYSHRALASAAALLRINIKWLYPEEYMSAKVKYDAEALKGADAVFITNIDYYGGTWEHADPGIPTLIDNAHGAYLKFVDKRIFGSKFLHPLEMGFPLISAESAHKTLPVLTGGAYLHFSAGADYSRAKEMMAMFGTSSPSYLILESLDRFNSLMTDNVQMVNNACAAVESLKKRFIKSGIPIKNSDHLRIVIDAAECGVSGFEYARRLRAKDIECEMADENNVVLLFSARTTVADCERAETNIMLVPMRPPKEHIKFPHIYAKQEMPMWEAMFMPSETVSVECAAGRVCAALKAPCPPGVPLIFPGEMIDRETADILKMHNVHSVAVIK